MRPPSAVNLYWSIRGEVACEAHAPDYDDPRWTIEGWAPMPESLLRRRGTRYQCQHCVIDGRAFVHPHSDNRPH
jgi:hypothetical protein